MSAHAIRFDTDGTATCLWTEALPLSELGRLSISRASTIEFNNVSGMWEVAIDRQILCWSKSRQFCLDWEHEYFNQKLTEG